ncbi:MAG TPA: glycoside hydrolase family 9 protein [archaeon]|nr:glycoside hydrolase family 9 protein [archaeon]
MGNIRTIASFIFAFLLFFSAFAHAASTDCYDLNADGKVNLLDMILVATKIGTNDSTANINKSTSIPTVTLSDLILISRNFRVCSVLGIESVSISPSQVTSNSVRLSWNSFVGATEYKIYIMPEPDLFSDPTKIKLIGTVSGTTTTFTATNISAATDAFFMVKETSSSKYGRAYAKTLGGYYAKTLGGDGTHLNTPLRSAHLVAPNILLLILENKRVQSFSQVTNNLDKGVEELVNYDGQTWQSGPWTVRRNNGSQLTVSNIYRNSLPIGNFYYGGGATNDHLLDVDHYIYLKLNENIGSNEVLEISGPKNISFILPYSDKYLETPIIQVNQVGYNPRATERYAYVGWWMGDGGGIPFTGFSTSAKVLGEQTNPLNARTPVRDNLPITLRRDFDADAGSEVREISLASVPQNDTTYYRVYIPGVGVSYRTMVSELGALKAFYVTSRALFHNRWGRDLQCAYTDWCAHPPDHKVDPADPTKPYPIYTYDGPDPTESQFLPQKTPQTGQRSLQGGFHDAGDFDQSSRHEKVSRQLMRVFELNPAAFYDGELNIPESGNGIPDLLDEALWGVSAWEQLQEENGGVRPRVESYRHPLRGFAETDAFPYWAFAVDPVHTARVAGMFAQASRLVQPYNQQKSDELKQRAIDAYDYAIANGVTWEIGGPFYYAAGELYALTGEQEYKDAFENAWAQKIAGNTGGNNSVQIWLREYWNTAYDLPSDQPIMADQIVSYLKSPNVNQLYYDGAILYLSRGAETNITNIQNTFAYRNSRHGGGVDYGLATANGNTLAPIYTLNRIGNVDAQKQQQYFNTMSLTADFVLGANPNGMVWISGLGSVSPIDTLHHDTLAFMLEGKRTMPGITVYGPSAKHGGREWYDYGENAMYPAFTSHPLMRRYGDIHTFIINNEFTVHETFGSSVSLFGALVKPGLQVPESWKPGRANHQNTLPK